MVVAAAPPQYFPAELDTLGQVAHNPAEQLKKKAKRKAITIFLADKLIELNGPNTKAYNIMKFCNSTLRQRDQELKSEYCKNRLCLVCNSIKTANLINGYLPELEKFQNPYFVTLTIKAVEGRFLVSAINKMQKNIRAINKHLTKYHGFKLKGIRKLEINYNLKQDTYNPHFHIITDGLQHAAYFLHEWLKKNPYSDDHAQDIRRADHKSLKELFKYTSKLISKDGNIHPDKIDKIYSALKRKRVIQPFGIKKFVDEDAREKTNYEHLTPDNAVWEYSVENFDWINHQTGEYLAQYEPDEDILELYGSYRL